MFNQTYDRRTFLTTTATLGLGALSNVALLRPVATAQVPPGRVPPLEVLLPSFAHLVEVSRLIAQEWRKLGLDIRLNTRSFHSVFSLQEKRAYGDVGMMTWGARDERLDPNWFLEELYHSSRAERGRNIQMYTNPEADRFIEAQKRELDREKRQALVWKVQEVVAKDYPIWYIDFLHYVQAYRTEWTGVTPRMGGGGFVPFSPWTYLNLRSTHGKKIFTITTQYLLTSSNPFQPGGALEQAWVRFIYDTFTKVDVNLNVIPWAAAGWTQRDDVTYDLRLRNSMRWHDGRPVTIADAKFSFDLVQEVQPSWFKHITDVVAGTEIIDDSTLRITLHEPFAPFLLVTLGYMLLLPKHIWEWVDDPLRFENKHMIGSGFFKFGHWRKKEELLLRTHTEHFRAPTGIERLLILDVPAPDIALGMLETGASDAYGWFLTPDQIDAVTGRQDLALVETEAHGFDEVRGLMTKKPCADVHFRKALYHAIPKEEIVKDVLGGHATVAKNTPISPKLTFWHNPHLEPVEYSIDKARQTLQAAGYSWDADGHLHYPAG